MKKDNMGGRSSTHEVINTYRILANLKGRGHSESLSVDGKIILEWILRDERGRVWIGFILLSMGTSGGLL
jgi:hypothetical protein